MAAIWNITKQQPTKNMRPHLKEWYEWGGMQGGLLCIVSAAIKRQYIRRNKIIHWVAAKICLKFKPHLFRLYLDQIQTTPNPLLV